MENEVEKNQNKRELLNELKFNIEKIADRQLKDQYRLKLQKFKWIFELEEKYNKISAKDELNLELLPNNNQTIDAPTSNSEVFFQGNIIKLSSKNKEKLNQYQLQLFRNMMILKKQNSCKDKIVILLINIEYFQECEANKI